MDWVHKEVHGLGPPRWFMDPGSMFCIMCKWALFEVWNCCYYIYRSGHNSKTSQLRITRNPLKWKNWKQVVLWSKIVSALVMVLIQPLRFNLSCPLVTALFTVKYIHLQIEDSTPVVDSYFKIIIISIIVVFTFLGFVKKLTLFLGTKTLLSMMTFENYSC